MSSISVDIAVPIQRADWPVRPQDPAELWRLYAPQRAHSPIFDPPRAPWTDWPTDTAKRLTEWDYFRPVWQQPAYQTPFFAYQPVDQTPRWRVEAESYRVTDNGWDLFALEFRRRPGLYNAYFIEGWHGIEAEPYRAVDRATDDVWNVFRSFTVQRGHVPGLDPPRPQWTDWPKDEGRRLDGWDVFRPYWVQKSPFFVGAHARTPWTDWPKDEAQRPNEGTARLYMQQRGLQLAIANPPRPQWSDWSKDEGRRLDGWDYFRSYWAMPPQPAAPFPIGQPIDKWSRLEAEGFYYRRPAEWDYFRPYWAPQPPFFTGSFARVPWSDWPKDEAQRPNEGLQRLYIPQRGLQAAVFNPPRAPWSDWPKDEGRRLTEWDYFRPVWTSAQPAKPFFVDQPVDKWSRVEAEGFRRVSDNGWDLFTLLQNRAPGLNRPSSYFVEPWHPIEAEPYRVQRATDDLWSLFRVYLTQRSHIATFDPPRTPWSDWPKDEGRRLTEWDYFRPYWTAAPPFFVGTHARTPWSDWPKDEAQRPNEGLARLYIPQSRLPNPVFDPPRPVWTDWPADQARRLDGWDYFRSVWTPPPLPAVPFFVGQPIDKWHRIEAESFRRVSENGWDLFALVFNRAPGLYNAYFIEGWHGIEAEPLRSVPRETDDVWSLFRLVMKARRMSPAFDPPRPPWAEWPKDEGRRLTEWDVFRPYYPSRPPFFVGTHARTPWSDWPKDEAQRPNEGLARLYMPQNRLQLAMWPYRGTGEAEVFRRVNDDVTSYRLYFVTRAHSAAFDPPRAPWGDWPTDAGRRLAEWDVFRPYWAAAAHKAVFGELVPVDPYDLRITLNADDRRVTPTDPDDRRATPKRES